MHRRTEPWAGTQWREGSKRGGRVLHKGVTAGDGNPLGILRRRGMVEEEENIDAKKSAHAQTPALGASVGDEFKSFTCESRN